MWKLLLLVDLQCGDMMQRDNPKILAVSTLKQLVNINLDRANPNILKCGSLDLKYSDTGIS